MGEELQGDPSPDAPPRGHERRRRTDPAIDDIHEAVGYLKALVERHEDTLTRLGDDVRHMETTHAATDGKVSLQAAALATLDEQYRQFQVMLAQWKEEQRRNMAAITTTTRSAISDAIESAMKQIPIHFGEQMRVADEFQQLWRPYLVNQKARDDAAEQQRAELAAAVAENTRLQHEAATRSWRQFTAIAVFLLPFVLGYIAVRLHGIGGGVEAAFYIVLVMAILVMAVRALLSKMQAGTP